MYMYLQQPVVITDSDLVSPALRWDLDYLQENIGDGDYSTYESDSHVFRYFDEKKVPHHEGYTPSMKRTEIKFQEFVERVTHHKPGDKRYNFTIY